MLKKLTLAVVTALAGLALSAANATTVSELIGQPAQSLKGERVGTFDELILDVREGRVLYVVVGDAQRYVTLPVRALFEGLRVDMSLASAVAHVGSEGDPKFRRAGRLLGQTLEQPGGEPIGTIADIDFDLQSGQVQHVRVETPQGARNFPPSVLVRGRFPALTRWQAEQPTPEVEAFDRRRAPAPGP